MMCSVVLCEVAGSGAMWHGVVMYGVVCLYGSVLCCFVWCDVDCCGVGKYVVWYHLMCGAGAVVRYWVVWISVVSCTLLWRV